MQALTDVIVPIFLIVLVGWYAGRRRMLGEAAAGAINGFVYYFALPAMMFVAIARTPLPTLFNGPYLGSFAGAYALTFLASLAFGRLVLRSGGAAAVLQAANASYANTGYVGIPVLLATFGEVGLAPGGLAAVLSGGMGLLFGVVALELATRSGGGPLWKVGLKLVVTLARTPMIVAVVLGGALSFAEAALPRPVENFAQLLGGAAAPGALFAIGLFLGGRPFRFDLHEVGWMVAVKLCLQPAIAYALAITIFPMDAFWTACAVLLSALPGAATSFILAQQYGTYREETSSAILWSTILSVPTLAVLMNVLLPLPGGVP